MRPAESVHAAERGRVRVRVPGRILLAELVYWPSDGVPVRGRPRGQRARVKLPNGSYLSVPTADVELIEPPS